MSPQPHLQHYLENYAQAKLAKRTECYAQMQRHTQAVVIPVYNESCQLETIWREALTNLKSQAGLHSAQPGKVLIVLVFNYPMGATSNAIDCTKNAWHQAQSLGQCHPLSDQLTWVINQDYDLALINCLESGLPVNQGVGLARKIGMDFSVRLYHQGILQSPWVGCTDADVVLPQDYFNEPRFNLSATDLGKTSQRLYGSQKEISAVIYPFSHHPYRAPKKPLNEDVHVLLIEIAHYFYELYLRHYVAGLRYANSPYAFHTIGSVLKVNLNAYVQVRGFPKKNAAEDFYLLNKLAKVGPVVELKTRSVKIQPRLSDRTPFGTGQQVSTLINTFLNNRDGLVKSTHNRAERGNVDHISKVFCTHLTSTAYFFAPACFERLRQLMDSVRTCGESNHLLMKLNELEFSSALSGFLMPALSHCSRQAKDEAAFQRHFFQWFDAFKTLKWLRLCRKETPDVCLNTARDWGGILHSHQTDKNDNCAQIQLLLSKLK